MKRSRVNPRRRPTRSPAREAPRKFCMRKCISVLLVALLTPALAVAAPNPKLTIPSFSALAQKATESVTITLDPGLLGLAAKFLDSSDPQDAATKDVLKGLQGIYV